MTEKTAGAAGVAAVAIFWIALCVFAALYPGYSHDTKAISELGAFGAPHAVAWNLIGFIVPGVLLAVCGAGLAAAIDRRGRKSALYWLLVLTGLGFAGTGVIPADMSGGSPQMQSPFTLGHLAMSFLSGIAWVIAAFVVIGGVKRNPSWQRFRSLSVVLAVLCIAGFASSVFARAVPGLAERPGLAQRILFAIYSAWFLVMAVHLLSAAPRARQASV